jgi:nicotinate-nucleotide adenylyltransferase
LVVISPKNPWKSEGVYIQTPTERLEAVRKVILDYSLDDKCEASDIEFSRSQPIYTVDTLRQIQALYPGEEIRYVCGADCLDEIMRWKEGRVIIEDIGMIVFPRSGYDLEEVLKKYPKAKIIASTKMPREISSTEIRRRFEEKEDYFDLTPVVL